MLNWRLWLGLIFVGILFFTAVFGSELAPYPEDFNKMIDYVTTDHGKEIRSAPFPPSSEHWFGTDSQGYDLFSQLLYGAKFTMFTAFLVAFARVLIGGFAGVYAGIRSNVSHQKPSFGVLGSLPAFLIVFFVMAGITINTPLSPLQHTIILAGLMTFVGIPGVFGVVRSKTVEVKKHLFVIAAVSLGGNRLHLVKKHIFPHVKGNLMILFVNEMIFSLGLLGQLGIFKIFLGGTIYRPHALLIKYTSKTHEWLGFIGQFRDYLFNSQWVVVFPICAVVFAIFSFYLLSSGLEVRQKEAQQRFPYI